jgi:hypothetical protein
MDQTFMLIVIPGPQGPPPEDVLAAMKMTLAQALDLMKRIEARQLTTLQNTGGGYRVMLEPQRTSHPDFGDLPLLQAQDNATAEERTAVLAVVRTYTRAFFDKSLKGVPSTILDVRRSSPYVREVNRFPARTRPRR